MTQWRTILGVVLAIQNKREIKTLNGHLKANYEIILLSYSYSPVFIFH